MVIRANDELELIELMKLASKGITEDEIEDVISEYNSNVEKELTRNSFEARKEEYKRKKSNEGFSTGKGGFRRST
jgi:IS30 family transposase